MMKKKFIVTFLALMMIFPFSVHRRLLVKDVFRIVGLSFQELLRLKELV